jgi:GNAT superfamily N-acetyltransferase
MLTALTADRLAPPARPVAGAEVRPLAGDADWAQALELRLACAEGAAGQRAFSERQVAGERALTEAGHGAWFGAFLDGRMRAGAGVFSDGGGLARFQRVETHPAFRRRGLAAAVVHAAGSWGLAALGAATLVIVADPTYHAIRLYRSLGFTDTHTTPQLTRPPTA